jgi:hypothetical protein
MRLSILCSVFCILCSFASAQWEPDVRLTNDPAETYTAAPNNHPLCASGDSLYTVFTDDRTGEFQVYFMRSLDAGTAWDSAVCLSADPADVFTPALAVSGATVHVVWPTGADMALMYRRSTDAGATWSDEDTLVASTAGLGDPSLAASGNTVGIAWGDERDGNYNGEVYLKRSSDGGQTWGPDTRLTFRADTIDKEPCLAIVGNSWHLAWTQMDWANFHTRAWYQRSTDGGASWLTPDPLTLDTTSQNQPQVAAVGPNVHVCWWDGRPGGYGIWYHGSTDNGATWNTERYLADTTHGSDYPGIAAVVGNVHVVFRTWSGGHFFINYCGSTDNGQTWSAETALTTADGLGTAAPAAAGSLVHLVLYDNRDGNSELYYKRNPTASGVEETRKEERGTKNTGPTIVRGVLLLPYSLSPSIPLSLLDVSGRKVMQLRLGANDVSVLSPGVYFVREQSAVGGEPSAVQKIVIQR